MPRRDARCRWPAKVIGAPELEALVDASLDGWLTEGRFAQRFAPAFAHAAARDHALLVGSGSQANLLAVAAACSHLHERPLRPGDEVVTPALGFSTTVSPIYQQGLVPVYVDVEPDTLNPTLEAFADAHRRPHPRRRGRPLPRQPLRRGAAGGALRRARPRPDRGLLRRARLDPRRPAVGTFGAGGHLLVLSRPPHDDRRGRRRRRPTTRPGCARSGSLREWGRDCWCPPGVNDACGRRFDGQLRRAARGLRPQVRLLARRLQLQDHRHAGRARASPSSSGSRASTRARRRNFARLDAALRRARRPDRRARARSRAPTRPGSAIRSRCARAGRPSAASCSASCSSAGSTRAWCSPETSPASRAIRGSSTAWPVR